MKDQRSSTRKSQKKAEIVFAVTLSQTGPVRP